MNRGAASESYLELRTRMVAIGIWTTYALCGAELIWLFFSWDHGNRPLIAALLVVGVIGTFVLQRSDYERIVRSRHCETFFLAWSLGDIAIVGISAALDGGAASPAVGGFFCVIVFAALSYPLRSVALVGGLSVLAFLTAGILAGGGSNAGEMAYLWIFAVCLAIVAVMCVCQARVQEERRAELARLSCSDPLTGALNRRGFGERLDSALAGERRADATVALLVLDLDAFKAVNDRDGHAAGDALLRDLVAQALRAVRTHDAVGRLGGDEFALLLPGSDGETAIAVADRIADALPATVGFSYGIACAPQDGATGEALHRRADERLYAAKRRERVPA